MKQNFKNYLKLGILLFGISFVLINCQKEEGFEEQTQTNELLMNYKEITFNDFKSKNSANHSLLNKSILKSNNASIAFRGPNESNTYSIDSTNIVSIEHVNGYFSYTFLVTSTTEPNLIQNIFISNAIDGTTAIYLLEYDTDIPVNEINDATLDEHIIQKTIYDLENPNFDYQNRGDILVCYDLTTTTVFQCDNGDLVTESNHPECFKNGQNIGSVTIITVSTVCETGGGGGNPDVADPTDTEGDNTSGGGGGNGESGGNQGDENNDDTPCQEDGTSTSFNDGNGKCIDGITTIIKKINNDDECNELKKNSDDENFQERMRSLETNITGTAEYTFGLYNGSLQGPQFPNPMVSPIIEGTDSQNAPSAPQVPELKAIAHNHLKDSIYNHIGTFSPNDLIALSNLVVYLEDEESQVQQHEIATYLVADEGNYVLKINDKDKLYNFAIKYGTDVDFKNKVDKFYKNNNMVHGRDKMLQNLGFLKLMEDYDIGVELYEADENFENWEKLERNDAGTAINKTPC